MNFFEYFFWVWKASQVKLEKRRIPIGEFNNIKKKNREKVKSHDKMDGG